MDNATRWSSKVHMLRRSNQIGDELIEASEHPDAAITLDSSANFEKKTNKYYRMMAEIDVVSKYLQYRGRTLENFRADLDTSIDAVNEEKRSRDSPLFGCKLGTKYISDDSEIVHSVDFERGILKLQGGLGNALTENEKAATKSFEKEEVQAQIREIRSSTSVLAERLDKRRRVDDAGKKYIDKSFVLGSTADIERLFSVAKHILTQERHAMTPQIFEAILFLKFNTRLWDVELVGIDVEDSGKRSDASEILEI